MSTSGPVIDITWLVTATHQHTITGPAGSDTWLVTATHQDTLSLAQLGQTYLAGDCDSTSGVCPVSRSHQPGTSDSVSSEWWLRVTSQVMSPSWASDSVSGESSHQPGNISQRASDSVSSESQSPAR